MATDELARQAVDAIEGISGHHPGFRPAHAKGMLCAATFTPTADAARLTRAAHFRDGPVRAHVRFSNGGGNPNDPDFEPREARGMATKFYVDDGTTTDLIGITLPAFFVGSLDGFFDFCRARTPDAATGEPDPAAIGAFPEQHPEALTAGAAALSATPPERATCAARTAHCTLTASSTTPAAAGTSATGGSPKPARGVSAPRMPRPAVPTTSGTTSPHDGRTLRPRSRCRCRSPRTATPSTIPASRGPRSGRVTMGRLEVTGLAHDREQGDDVLVFDPTRVTDGIELSDDPILRFRTHAYAESVLRRTGVARDGV